MLPVEFTGITTLVGSVGFMFLVVPTHRIKDMLIFGLVAGAGVAFLLVYIMETYGFWHFPAVDFFNILGIPVFLSLSWMPLVISFAFLLAEFRHIWERIAIFMLFPLGATALHYFLLHKGGLIYNGWSLMLTFLVSVGIHLLILAYLVLTAELEIRLQGE